MPSHATESNSEKIKFTGKKKHFGFFYGVVNPSSTLAKLKNFRCGVKKSTTKIPRVKLVTQVELFQRMVQAEKEVYAVINDTQTKPRTPCPEKKGGSNKPLDEFARALLQS